jgi:hypothetical protein
MSVQLPAIGTGALPSPLRRPKPETGSARRAASRRADGPRRRRRDGRAHPVAADPADETVDELVAVYRAGGWRAPRPGRVPTGHGRRRSPGNPLAFRSRLPAWCRPAELTPSSRPAALPGRNDHRVRQTGDSASRATLVNRRTTLEQPLSASFDARAGQLPLKEAATAHRRRSSRLPRSFAERAERPRRTTPSQASESGLSPQGRQPRQRRNLSSRIFGTHTPRWASMQQRPPIPLGWRSMALS